DCVSSQRGQWRPGGGRTELGAALRRKDDWRTRGLRCGDRCRSGPCRLSAFGFEQAKQTPHSQGASNEDTRRKQQSLDTAAGSPPRRLAREVFKDLPCLLGSQRRPGNLAHASRLLHCCPPVLINLRLRLIWLRTVEGLHPSI